MTRKDAAVLIVCVALSACDGASTRDITAPDAGAVSRDPAVGAVGHPVIRANGEVLSPPAVRAKVEGEAFRPAVRGAIGAVGAAATAATPCDAGILDPEGFPEGGLTGGTYGDVEVPPGAICVLQDATVTGSVTALADSRLFIRNSQIGVDVLGLGASAVQVSEETRIAGNMEVRNAHDALFASCSVDNAEIVGDLTCAKNDPGSPIVRAEQGPTVIGGSVNFVDNVIPGGNVLLLLNASIGGDADVNRNTGAGFKSVNGNTVANRLKCKGNDPIFSGGPNTAGKAKGQCF